MTLVNKETRGSYNTVVTNINQKINTIITSLDKLIQKSSNNTKSFDNKINELNKEANNLMAYALGVKRILQQLDAFMPGTCDYDWIWTEPSEDCSYGNCGEE